MKFFRNLKHLYKRWIQPVFPFKQMFFSVPLYFQYLADWKRYCVLPNSESLSFEESYPALFDKQGVTSFDSHYFYQSFWAMKSISNATPPFHLDVGSLVDFVGMITAITQVIFLDIRPLHARLENLNPIQGDILKLPFAKNSIPSISCLHVAEHIGLGRYGDLLDPEGTKKAARELARVIAPGGNLYFSLPIGRSRVCFNAHRVHSPGQILDYFRDLDLIQFSVITDDGRFLEKVDPKDFSNSNYACGLFHFGK